MFTTRTNFAAARRALNGKCERASGSAESYGLARRNMTTVYV
jgi:hypothetical protein